MTPEEHERLARVEVNVAHVAEVQEALQQDIREIHDVLVKQKGFIGGVLAVGSIVGASLSFLFAWFKANA